MSNAELVLAALIAALNNANTLAMLFQKAQFEGRDLTDAEVDQVRQAALAAQQALKDAVSE